VRERERESAGERERERERERWVFEIASLDIGRMTVMLYLSFQETDFQVQSP